MDTSEWRNRTYRRERPTKMYYKGKAIDYSFIAGAVITFLLSARFLGVLWTVLLLGPGGCLMGLVIYLTIGKALWKAYCRKYPNMPER